MLGTITPLGERSRNRRWGITMTGYLAGSAIGGSAMGLLLGKLGAGVWSVVGYSPGTWTVLTVALLATAGWLVDVHAFRLSLVTFQRQVSQEWPRRYRGFVYGFGFGVQLGAGLTTVVTTSAVYLVFLGSFLYGSPAAGFVAGLTFGVVRAGVNFITITSRTPANLARMHMAVHRAYRPVKGVLETAQAATGFGIATLIVIAHV